MADLFREFFWIIFPVGGMCFAAFAVWNEFSRQKKALEVLKVYAEKGQEPPDSVLAVLTKASSAPPSHRRHPLPQAAFFCVLALGLAALTFWTAHMPGLIVFTMGFALAAVALAALAASAYLQHRFGRGPDAP